MCPKIERNLALELKGFHWDFLHNGKGSKHVFFQGLYTIRCRVKQLFAHFQNNHLKLCKMTKNEIRLNFFIKSRAKNRATY
jgi:hypothetical protein